VPLAPRRRAGPRRALHALVAAAGLLAGGLLAPGAGAISARGVKIVGGSVAAPGQFPWMVALVDPATPDAVNGQFCGGTVIAPRVVLTAAHCVYGSTPSQMEAVIGRTRLSQAADGQRLKVTRVVRHPDYDPKSTVNDVALIQLAQPATVTPVPLDGPADVGAEAPATEVLTSGWGTVAEGGENSSDDLRFVRLRIRSPQRCQALYGAGVSATKTVCAGSSRAGEDSCQGDSGGPLLRGEGDAMRLVGLVSFGSGCGRANVPGVYTRVAAFATFISQQSAVLNGDAAPPPVVPGAPVVRIGKVGCGPKTCTVNFRVSGRVPGGGIVLNVYRARYGTRKRVDRFVVARRISSTRFVAQTDLPFGRLTLYAIPVNQKLDDLDGDGDVVEISIYHG
jgi:trypsin